MNKLLKKVESMDESERDHLRQLLKERHKEEASGKGNLEWMYKEDRPAEEDYLLGRRIDKYVDKDQKKEEQEIGIPETPFSEVMAKRADLDMQCKMREDPLYAIRKKEEEARRRLLENPIKMKQLQKVIQQRADDHKKKKKKKKKKNKKHKKKRASDSGDSSDSDSDDELMQTYLSILTRKKRDSKSSGPLDGSTAPKVRAGSSKDSDNGQQKYRSSPPAKSKRAHSDSDSKSEDPSPRRPARQDSHSSAGSEGHTEGQANALKKEAIKSHHHGDQSSDSDEEARKRLMSDEDESGVQPKAYGLIVKGKECHSKGSTRKSRSKSPLKAEKSLSKSPKQLSTRSRSKSPKASHRRSRSPKRQQKRSRSPRGSSRRSRSRSPRRRSRRSRSKSPKRSSKQARSPDRHRSRSPRRDRKSPPRKDSSRKKLSAEEMEQRRKEMVSDAKLHDTQRLSNVERYKREDDHESEQLKKQIGKEADFISPIMSDHASQSSVEDRLKRNRYHIQRTKVDLDRPFNK